MSKSSVIKDEHRGWWGIHYDDRGIERTRQSFRSREDARVWVKAMKAKERGDLDADRKAFAKAMFP